jgi:hypothetical protein
MDPPGVDHAHVGLLVGRDGDGWGCQTFFDVITRSTGNY